jgi:hypothetical protein
MTLAIASVSSVVAAVVVSRIWGPGTLIGAAATPVIVTLVGDLLRKPAQVITVVRPSTGGRGPGGTEVHQHAAPRPRVMTPETVEPAATPGPFAPAARRGLQRRTVIAALVTGLVAFAIGAFVLTSGELVFGGSAAGRGDTTLFSSGGSHGTTKTRTTKTTETTPTTVTKTTTTTAPAETTPPTTSTTQTVPAVPAGPTGASGATGATGP